MKKVLVTGHSGFVGQHVVKLLEKYNSSFLVLKPKIDLRNQNEVDLFFYNHTPYYVIHCAARVGGIKENINNQFDFLLENLQMQNNVIKSSLKYGVAKVIFLGSSCIYPKDYTQPLKEEYLLNAPLEPTNEGYSLAKIAGLKLCEYANRMGPIWNPAHPDYHTKFISLMPCNLFGEGDCFDLNRSHVMSALIKKIIDAKRSKSKSVTIWGSGKARREFLYVKDLAECILWSITNINKTDTFLNVGMGDDISILNLVKKIAGFVGYKGDFYFDRTKPDGMLKKCLDVTKINKLGWYYKTSLDEGIKNTIKYYESLL